VADHWSRKSSTIFRDRNQRIPQWLHNTLFTAKLTANPAPLEPTLHVAQSLYRWTALFRAGDIHPPTRRHGTARVLLFRGYCGARDLKYDELLFLMF